MEDTEDMRKNIIYLPKDLMVLFFRNHNLKLVVRKGAGPKFPKNGPIRLKPSLG